MRDGLLMEHLKEELASMMCCLEGNLYYFAHSIIAVCTHCAGVLQYTRQVCVCVYTECSGRKRLNIRRLFGDFEQILL
jgi:hypothetical protein